MKAQIPPPVGTSVGVERTYRDRTKILYAQNFVPAKSADAHSCISSLDVHRFSFQPSKWCSPPADWKSRNGLILMCMKPRAISRESATSMGTSGHVRTADMLECKGFALVMHEVHGSPCAPANIVIIHEWM